MIRAGRAAGCTRCLGFGLSVLHTSRWILCKRQHAAANLEQSAPRPNELVPTAYCYMMSCISAAPSCLVATCAACWHMVC